jgi:hypothetical protein
MVYTIGIFLFLDKLEFTQKRSLKQKKTARAAAVDFG